MNERLTSRDSENRLLFAGHRVIAGEHAQAYLELEEAEDRIIKLEAELNALKIKVSEIRKQRSEKFE